MTSADHMEGMTPSSAAGEVKPEPAKAMDTHGSVGDSHDGAESARGHNDAEGMAEPPPASMDGRRILIIFAILNAAVLSIAAFMKFRRNATPGSREVKA